MNKAPITDSLSAYIEQYFKKHFLMLWWTLKKISFPKSDPIKIPCKRKEVHIWSGHLKHLSPECKLLLSTAGDMVEANVLEDPDYHVASN